jgi:hypothetical protein
MVKFKAIINKSKSFKKINIESLNHKTSAIDSFLPCYAYVQTSYPANAFCICGSPSSLSPALFTFDRILFINQPSAVSLRASVALLAGYADPAENVDDPSFIIYPQKSINGIFALYLLKDRKLNTNVVSSKEKIEKPKCSSSTETSNPTILFRPMNYHFPCPAPPFNNYSDEQLSVLSTLLLQVMLCSEKVCEVCFYQFKKFLFS